MKPLTPTQLKVLAYVVDHIDRKHFAPSIIDITFDLDYSSTATIRKALEVLAINGLVYRAERNAARALIVTEKGREAAKGAMKGGPS
jgi:predicted MarR family transcription regulator